MKIKSIVCHTYTLPLKSGASRSGILISITDDKDRCGWGEIAPLSKWSKETLEECVDQLHDKKKAILNIDWLQPNSLSSLYHLFLYPSVYFGLESAFLSLLMPLPPFKVSSSALLMGTPEEILKQAEIRSSQKFRSAKLKVGHLSFKESAKLIHLLKDKFHLRIDVNRAWETEDSLRFFSQFQHDTFDYVEEPFKNPKDLQAFPYPLAVDESFPHDLLIEDLEKLPMLKALIYKPTMQSGMLGCIPLHEWSKKRGVSIVLSSSFESDIGLSLIGSMACRLSLASPIGIGTFHYLSDSLCDHSPEFSKPDLFFSGKFIPKKRFISGSIDI